MSDEKLSQADDAIEIGTERYLFTQQTKQFLDRAYTSTHPKDTSVVLLDEPHESSEGQFNLFKGLESFFASNPRLVEQTIFLSEGTAANKPISVQALIDEEPHPSDDVIRQVLQSHLITGYIAYEWKYQWGIPIMGVEDEGLYTLSARWASVVRENQGAIFQERRYTDHKLDHDIPLSTAWSFAVAARNKKIAETLIEQTSRFHNPMLFVAWDHLKDQRDKFSKNWDAIIKRNILKYKGSGPMYFMTAGFNPESMGMPWEDLCELVPDDCEMFDIDHYLTQAKVGYTFVEPRGSMTAQDTQNYNRIFRVQRE